MVSMGFKSWDSAARHFSESLKILTSLLYCFISSSGFLKEWDRKDVVWPFESKHTEDTYDQKEYCILITTYNAYKIPILTIIKRLNRNLNLQEVSILQMEA